MLRCGVVGSAVGRTAALGSEHQIPVTEASMISNINDMVTQFGPQVYVIYFAVFCMGATTCSAIMCATWRHARHESWTKGRSKCEHCGRELCWWEVIPVVSCLALRGRCRTCKYAFGYIHAVLEFMLGLAWFFDATLYPSQSVMTIMGLGAAQSVFVWAFAKFLI